MAKFELKFIDVCDDGYIRVESTDYKDGDDYISICINDDSLVLLDKSTAIKFAKTLRTEINKITESEVKNG